MFRRELVLRAPSVDFWGYKKCGLPAAVLTKGTKSLVEGTRTVRGKMVRAPILDQDTLMIMGKMGGYQAECPNSDALTAGTEGVAELTTKEKVVITRQNLGTWSTQVVLQPGDYDDVTSLGLTDDQLSCLSIYASAIILSTEYGNVSGKTCLVLGSNTPVGAVLSNVLTSAGAKVTAVPWNEGADAPSDLPEASFIFNGIGGKVLRAATDKAAQDCTVVSWSNLSGEQMDVAGTRAFMSGLQMRGFWYQRWLSTSTPQHRQDVYKKAAAVASSAKSPLFKTSQHSWGNFETAFNAASPVEVPILAFA
eukprot:TRINITY_DN6255_c1_g1_i3.p1 TRINITY_DN6255_c1_g1~~TRINITY_DN6255_c1_g1_i3.p1  ORF type:complete len:320 (+),score=40.42 TRINITY_DN6255_c1_g1_i3:42-962(+)